jgi:hypothetical protein
MKIVGYLFIYTVAGANREVHRTTYIWVVASANPYKGLVTPLGIVHPRCQAFHANSGGVKVKLHPSRRPKDDYPKLTYGAAKVPAAVPLRLKGGWLLGTPRFWIRRE